VIVLLVINYDNTKSHIKIADAKLIQSFFNLPASNNINIMANGHSARDSADLLLRLRMDPAQTTSINTIHEGTVAPPSSPIEPRARDDHALIDALGGYLTGEHQATLGRAEEAMRAEMGNHLLFREMWENSERSMLDQRHDMEWAIESRERVITLLLSTLYRAQIRRDMDATSDAQLEICASYVDELVTFARTNNTVTTLLRPDTIRTDVYNELLREDLSEITTDEDSEGSEFNPIDLTGDSEMEEL